MMKIPLSLSLLLIGCGSIMAAEDAPTWVTLPERGSQSGNNLTPILLTMDTTGQVTFTTLFFGIRRNMGTMPTKLVNGVYHIEADPQTSHEGTLTISSDHSAVTVAESGKTVTVFKNRPEWKARFENAASPPKNKKEAIEMMRRIFSPDFIKPMRREELDAVCMMMDPVVAAFQLDDPKAPKFRSSGEETKEIMLWYWESLQPAQ